MTLHEISNADRNAEILNSISAFLQRDEQLGSQFTISFSVGDYETVFSDPLVILIELTERKTTMGVSLGLINKLSSIFGCSALDIEFTPQAEVTQVPWTAEVYGWLFTLPTYEMALPIFNLPIDPAVMVEDDEEIDDE